MRTLMLGAEGCAEVQSEPWIRQATPDEVAAFKAHHKLDEKRISELAVDGIGRPYWFMTLTDEAPEWAKEACERYGRIRYLSDYRK